MMLKKGDVWVSAVLYIALGMILITLILSAGIPLIEKMRDKNTIIQTKRLLFNLNANIETVANEGLGSKRYLSPFEITSGVLNVDYVNDLLVWKMTTNSLMMEPTELNANVQKCIDDGKMNSDKDKGCGNYLTTFKEGALNMWMVETAVEGEYDMYIDLSYKNYIDIDYNLEAPTSLVGKYSVSIEQVGFSGNNPRVRLNVV